MLKNSRILITGGTGTLGQELVRQLPNYGCKEIVVFSRNEVAQVEMKRIYPNVTYVIGDVRDQWAVACAMKNINHVFNLAAIKSVPLCEQQPQEALQTNVNGTLNVIKESIKKGVKRVVNMSTDKASDPISFYGMTKALAERMVLQANELSRTEFINIRSGNIFGSSGSVIPFFVNQARKGDNITLTNGDMTRFFITVEDIASYMIQACNEFPARNTYTPSGMKSFKMMDIAEVVKELYGKPETTIKEVGIRMGEKMHECINGISSENNLGSRDDLENIFVQWTS